MLDDEEAVAEADRLAHANAPAGGRGSRPSKEIPPVHELERNLQSESNHATRNNRRPPAAQLVKEQGDADGKDGPKGAKKINDAYAELHTELNTIWHAACKDNFSGKVLMQAIEHVLTEHTNNMSILRARPLFSMLIYDLFVTIERTRRTLPSTPTEDNLCRNQYSRRRRRTLGAGKAPDGRARVERRADRNQREHQ